MRRTALALVLSLAGVVPVGIAPALAAMSVEEAEAILFRTIDRNADGHATPNEFENFRTLAFEAMDVDNDARVTSDEWGAFDPGFLGIANETGQLMELADAKDESFARYDTSGDGYLSNDEMTANLFRDFIAADADEDGRLTIEEHRETALIRALSEALQQ